VISVREHRTAAAPVLVDTERRVDVPRRRNLKPLHPMREREVGVRLREHMNVIALQADVYDPKPLAQSRCDRRIAHGLVERPATQVADSRNHAHHDMQRLIGPDVRPLLVRCAGARALRLTPRSLALPTAPEQLLLHMPLTRSPRRRLHVPLLPFCGFMSMISSLKSPI